LNISSEKKSKLRFILNDLLKKILLDEANQSIRTNSANSSAISNQKARTRLSLTESKVTSIKKKPLKTSQNQGVNQDSKKAIRGYIKLLYMFHYQCRKTPY